MTCRTKSFFLIVSVAASPFCFGQSAQVEAKPKGTVVQQGSGVALLQAPAGTSEQLGRTRATAAAEWNRRSNQLSAEADSSNRSPEFCRQFLTSVNAVWALFQQKQEADKDFATAKINDIKLDEASFSSGPFSATESIDIRKYRSEAETAMSTNSNQEADLLARLEGLPIGSATRSELDKAIAKLREVKKSLQTRLEALRSAPGDEEKTRQKKQSALSLLELNKSLYEEQLKNLPVLSYSFQVYYTLRWAQVKNDCIIVNSADEGEIDTCVPHGEPCQTK
jgi:hypothetical protein